jgi:hypothetical protein
MDWKFWKKNAGTNTSTAEKLSMPKEMPSQLGRHFVVNLQKPPDWVWSLKLVERIRPESKNIADIRIFDPAKVRDADLRVKNFHSLENHPELILFEGWMDKKTKEFKIEVKEPLAGATKAA